MNSRLKTKIFALILAITAVATISKVDYLLGFAHGKTQIINLDGETYTRTEIIDDFIHASFPQSFFGSDIGWPKSIKDDLAAIRIRYYEMAGRGWLSSNILYPRELPKFEVLRKWERETIEVAIGSPIWTDFQPDSNPDIARNFNESLDEIIAELAGGRVPEIHRISYEVDKERYTNDQNHVDMRIIPRSGWGNWPADPYNMDLAIPNRIPPTYYRGPFSGYVDEFILPLRKNEIGVGVCKVLYRFDKSDENLLEKSQIRALMGECMLTMLGLVGKFSQTSIEDKKGKALLKLVNPFDFISDKNVILPFSRYEEFMLHILYCPELRVGMTKREVRRALTKKSSQCLKK